MTELVWIMQLLVGLKYYSLGILAQLLGMVMESN